MMELESSKSLLQIAKALKGSRYHNKKIATSLCFMYKMLTGFDQINPNNPHFIRHLYEASELIALLTHFNMTREDFVSDFIEMLRKVPLMNVTDIGYLVKIKFAIVRYLRHQLLWPYKAVDDVAKWGIKFILKDCQLLGVKVAVEDYTQIYQYLLLTTGDTKTPIMLKLREIWDKANSETMVTKLSCSIFVCQSQFKFEQDVLDIVKHLPVKYQGNTNDEETGLETDIIITEYKGAPIKVAVEVNGVYHYCRNSELPLGKDLIKKKIW